MLREDLLQNPSDGPPDGEHQQESGQEDEKDCDQVNQSEESDRIHHHPSAYSVGRLPSATQSIGWISDQNTVRIHLIFCSKE